MPACDLLLHSATQLLTLTPAPQRGMQLGALNIVEDGALAISAGRIVAVGPTAELRAHYTATHTVDASGRVVLPGLVDPHTHVIWAGDRANEFEMRLAGKTYLEIMNAGGGIMSTVRQTRAASSEQLVSEARARLQRMLKHGTTTLEAKTGYGLDTATELKMLEVIQRLNAEGPWELIPTFIGAHAIPADYANRTDEFVELVVSEMLPAVAERFPGIFCDVFCEEGAFTVAQSRRILERARELGFRLKIHADEFVGLGGTKLAVELGAASADHLVYTPDEDIAALGGGETVAVGLPGTPFGLAQRDYTPAPKILAANGLLALASDLNPGTTWCESMQMVLALACRYMKLTPAQAIAAATINAARAIGRDADLGSLTVGKQADVVLLGVSDYRQLGYRYGTNLVELVIKAGRVVVDQRG